jgi:hypothetical protein
MSRLADTVDGMIGVDTTATPSPQPPPDPVGGLLGQTSVSADAAGYHCLFDFAQAQGPLGAAGRWKGPAATAPG